MSAWNVLPSISDQTVAQSLIVAAQAAFASIDYTFQPPLGMEAPVERGTFNYTLELRSHNMSYAILLFNIERTVIRAMTLSRIVAAAARHVQQVTLICRPSATIVSTTILPKMDTSPSSSSSISATAGAVEFRHVYYIRIDVYCDAYFNQLSSRTLETPQYNGAVLRASVARQALLQFADQHQQTPQPDVPLLHKHFKRDHVPVLASIIEIIQNMDSFLPRLDWRVYPFANESSQYTLAVWNIHKMTYEVLEYLYARIGAPIQDVRFEQTFDESLAVLLIDVDVSSDRILVPSVAGAIACRQRVQNSMARIISSSSASSASSSSMQTQMQMSTNNNDDDDNNNLRKRKRDINSLGDEDNNIRQQKM